LSFYYFGLLSLSEAQGGSHAAKLLAAEA